MTLAELESCREKTGYIYELIDGVLTVSPSSQIPHEIWKEYLAELLWAYARNNPESINFVASDCEVVIPGRPGVTRPRPDLAAYKNFPTLDQAAQSPEWESVCPALVVEIVSRRRRRKDTIRNRHLYWMAKGITEYWIIDPSKDARRPVLVALRREAKKPDWVERKVPFGERYESPALPGFAVNLADAGR